MAILKPEANKTYEIALKYKSGIAAKGKFGPQMMFTLTDGQILYLPVDVADSIAALNLIPQEPFLLTKQLAGNKISWSVERKPAAGPQLVTEKPALMTKLGEVLVHGLPVNSEGSNLLRIALRTAIDEAAEAEKYAAERGLSIRFGADDIRLITNTLVIQMAGGR